MEKEKLEMLYLLLWKEYKIAARGSHDTEEPRYAKDGEASIGSDEIRRRISILYDLLYRTERRLNIFAQEEFKVIYIGQEENYSIYKKGNEDSKNLPKLGEVYTVQEITPYESYVLVKLEEFQERAFDAAAFVTYDSSLKSEDELLKEYGQALYDDIKRIEQIKKGIDNMPELTDIEELQKIYDEYKGKKCIDPLDDMLDYIDFENGQTDFKIGDSFYDGSRKIEIINISDEKSCSGYFAYFCKVIEDKDGLAWYICFNQREMEVIRITDLNINEAELSKKEILIRKIMLETGGIMWGFARSEECIMNLPVPERRYSIGDCLEEEGYASVKILDVSETPDCYNSWIYFCKKIKLNDKNEKCCEYDILIENCTELQGK